MRNRGLRCFEWVAATLAVAFCIGLLPAVFVLLPARFEFGEDWRTAGKNSTGIAAGGLL